MRPAVLVAAAILALACCGCGSVPQTHYYVLEPQDLFSTAPSGTGLSIGVETFQVDPLYDQDRIVYRMGQDSAEVGFYAYHRWAAPLSRMLPGVVAAALSGLDGVESIGPVADGRDYDAYFRGRVLAFEEIDTPEGERILVRLALTLQADDGTELWVEILDREAALTTGEVRDAVERMREALEEGLRAARPGLERALRQARGR